MKIISWNVNGIRAVIRKGNFAEIVLREPDVFCLQEVKAEPEQFESDIKQLQNTGWFVHINPSTLKKGHSGTAVISRETPVSIYNGLPNSPELDREGRTVTAEFKDIIVVNTYTPNGGGRNGISDAFQFKLDYYDELVKHLQYLETFHKKLVLVGDINVTHSDIDLARPESNRKSIGCLPVEREKLDAFVSAGFSDVYRTMNPIGTEYTWWDVITRARDRNVGWRIDAAWVSRETMSHVKRFEHLTNQMGSDHCPFEIEL